MSNGVMYGADILQINEQWKDSSLSEAVQLFSLFGKQNTYNFYLPLYQVPKSMSGSLNEKTESTLITTQSGNGSCS